MQTREPSELKISYDHKTKIISLQAYDEGFFKQEIDITSHVVDLVIEKLFNDMNCPPNGGVLELTRKFDKRTKIEKIIGQIITKKGN